MHSIQKTLKRNCGLLAALIFLSAPQVHASTDLQTFLKNCAYGTLGGAVLGVGSLALTDKPSDHTGNIARGASLGLYAGIGYGLIKLNEVPAKKIENDPYASIVPILKESRLDGAQLLLAVARF